MTAGQRQSQTAEAVEQEMLFRWRDYAIKQYPGIELMFHIPNGGSRHPVEAARLKAQGVKAGVSDIFLPVPRNEYHGLWIEMKREKGGRVTEAQTEWIARMREQGYCAVVAHGFEEAKGAIERYYGDGNV